MRENYASAWLTVKEIIDISYKNFPKHQGTTDITEVINFAEISGDYELTQRQYDALINKAEKYYKSLGEK